MKVQDWRIAVSEDLVEDTFDWLGIQREQEVKGCGSFFGIPVYSDDTLPPNSVRIDVAIQSKLDYITMNVRTESRRVQCGDEKECDYPMD